MRYLAQQAGKTVPFFQDPAYTNINHIILSTSTVFSPNISIGAFAPVTSNGFGIDYMLDDDWAVCNITSYPDSSNPSDFVDLVRQSVCDIASVLEGRNFKL